MRLSPIFALATFAISSRALADEITFRRDGAPREEEHGSNDDTHDTVRVGSWRFRPDVQLRAQGEYRRDAADQQTTTGDAWTLWQRARLSLEGSRDNVRARVSLQEARAWGATSDGAVNAYEAFGEVKMKRARPAYLRVGRQEIRLGDGRLIGLADWRPAARSLDAALGHFSTELFDFDAFAAMLRDARPAGPGFGMTDDVISTGDQLYALSITGRFHPLFRVQAMGLLRVANSLDALGTNATRSRFLVSSTSGEMGVASLHVSGEREGWTYGVEGALEFGNTGVLDLNRFATAAAVRAGKRFDDIALRPRFRVGGSYASGDDRSGTYRQFDPILPELHAHYGAMDLFTWSNILEADFEAEIELSRDFHLAGAARYARMANDQGEWLSGYVTPLSTGGNPGRSKDLGEEFDVFATYRAAPEVTLHGGYSLYVLGQGAGDMLARTGRSDTAADGSLTAPGLSHFAYLQASFVLPEPRTYREEEK